MQHLHTVSIVGSSPTSTTIKGISLIELWVKRIHEEVQKYDCLRSCPSGIVFNLRFTDEDEVKSHVQKLHPKEHVKLHLCLCLKVDNQGL